MRERQASLEQVHVDRSLREARLLLLASAVLAGGAAVQSLTSEPRDLIPALVLALPPVMALAALALGSLGLVMFHRGDPPPPAHGPG